MNLEKESKLMTSRPAQPIGKSQVYALLVDAAGEPVLDGEGNKQVAALQTANGKLQVDAAIAGSLAMQTLGQAIPSDAILNGLSDGANIQAMRGASIFKVYNGTVAADAKATVWTPAVGKKIRLMGCVIGSATGGTGTSLRMGTAGSGTAIVNIITIVGTISIPLGQGKLAANANDVLEIYNPSGSAITYYITVFGTEE